MYCLLYHTVAAEKLVVWSASNSQQLPAVPVLVSCRIKILLMQKEYLLYFNWRLFLWSHRKHSWGHQKESSYIYFSFSLTLFWLGFELNTLMCQRIQVEKHVKKWWVWPAVIFHHKIRSPSLSYLLHDHLPEGGNLSPVPRRSCRYLFYLSSVIKDQIFSLQRLPYAERTQPNKDKSG